MAPAATAGSEFLVFSRRLTAEHHHAKQTWTPDRIAVEVRHYVDRIGTFEPGAFAADDAARGLELRRELVEACAARADTPQQEALALMGIAELIAAARDALLKKGNNQSADVTTALTILYHDVTHFSTPGEQL